MSFLCNFNNAAVVNKTTFGLVIYDIVATFLFYHVECPIPAITIATPVTVTLYKSTGQIYQFGGFSGANVITVQYYWTSVATSAASTLIVTGLGFNAVVAQSYKCIFTGKNSSNQVRIQSFISSAATSLTTLNCGLTPSGFAIISGTSTVNLTIFEANIDNSTGYQVQPLGSASITYSTCFDQVKDGDETDVDCGGIACGNLCSRGKNCSLDSDCLFSLCTNGVCTRVLANYNISQSSTARVLPGINSPQVNSLFQVTVASVSSGIIAQTSLTVTAGNFVRINAQTLYESGNSEDNQQFLICTAGPATPSGFLDLGLTNYATTLAGAPFGINNVRSSNGFGAAGQLSMFDSVSIYSDPDVDSTPQRMITNVLWKAPSNGTFQFFLVFISHGSAVRVPGAWNPSNGWNYEMSYTSLVVNQMLPQNAFSNYNVSQSSTAIVLPGINSPQVNSLFQVPVASVSSGIIAQTSLTVTAGNFVRINAQTLYESGNSEDNQQFLICTAGPATPSGFLDLGLTNYATTLAGAPFGINNVRSSNGFGAAGQLSMFDSVSIYSDPDVDSTPQRMITNVLWKAPSNGTFQFFLVFISHGSAVRVPGAWNPSNGWNYEMSYTSLSVQVIY